MRSLVSLEDSQPMNSSTSSFSHHSGARFALVLMVLVLGFEFSLWAWLPINHGRHEGDFVRARAARANQEVVLFSDSITYGALSLLDEKNGVSDLTSNQAMGVAGNYFLLRQLIAAGNAPKRVAYVIHPRSYEVDYYLFPELTESYFTTVFVENDEISTIEKVLNRADLAGRMREAQEELRFTIPSQIRRGIVHEPLIRGLRGLKRHLRGDFVDPQALELIEEQSALKKFILSDVSRLFMEKIAALTKAHEIELMLFPPPIPQSVLDTWKNNGYWLQYVSFMQSFDRRHPHARFTEDIGFGSVEDQFFGDGIHLTANKKREWGASVFEFISP